MKINSFKIFADLMSSTLEFRSMDYGTISYQDDNDTQKGCVVFSYDDEAKLFACYDFIKGCALSHGFYHISCVMESAYDKVYIKYEKRYEIIIMK